MRFSTIFFTLASLGAAYAAMEQPAVDEEMLVKREEFREPVKRSAQSWGGQGGWGKPWGGQPSNPGWGGPVWAVSCPTSKQSQSCLLTQTLVGILRCRQ